MTTLHQYSVLGIAFLVEERGRESRLVLRYPVSSSSSDTLPGDNAFYTLSPNVMAKFFRPKPALFNQPTTISVGETIFCCRSVPVEEGSDGLAFGHDKHGKDSGEKDELEQEDDADGGEIVVFSLIVALKKNNVKYSIGYQIDTSSLQPIFDHVHLNLERICLVLKREQKRCGYLSKQVAQFDKVILDESKTSEFPEFGVDKDEKNDTNHRKSRQGNGLPYLNNLRLQAIWELQMASGLMEGGNLARELAECFHALSRYDDIGLSPQLSIQSVQDHHGIVYINDHVAVPIIPIQQTSNHNLTVSLRPDHSLMLIKSNILDAYLIKAPKPLKLMIKCINPTKSFLDVSKETSLGLEVVMDLALFLVENASAFVVPKVSFESQFVCDQGAIEKMKKLALLFAQQFGTTIYSIVGLLTKGCRLGDILSDLKENKALREKLFKSNNQYYSQGSIDVEKEVRMDEFDVENTLVKHLVWLRRHSIIVELIEFVIASNIGVHQESMSLGSTFQSEASLTENIDIKLRNISGVLKEQEVFNELMRLKVLSGRYSKSALEYKIGFDHKRMQSFIDWGENEHKLVVVKRIPTSEDVI